VDLAGVQNDDTGADGAVAVYGTPGPVSSWSTISFAYRPGLEANRAEALHAVASGFALPMAGLV
jgi:hypothetical protein